VATAAQCLPPIFSLVLVAFLVGGSPGSDCALLLPIALVYGLATTIVNCVTD